MSQIKIREHGKVTHSHQQRLAYIYVRQSSLKQVYKNQESQLYQYRLKQRAQEYGWPPERIRVIDSDLGVSGQETSARVGFQELVTELSLGHVGIVFGYEVSRLARNNADWYHLLDLAALFGTLIADNDGIYDPRFYNDRLLLGLKGTMSEAELYLLRQRLDEGRMNQVKRGAYRQRLPTGYIRLPDGTAVKDPDDQVRHVLNLMFTQFDQLGSANKVMRYLRRRQILLPRRQNAGPQANQLLWKEASESAILDMLHNPTYAGAFAYGRRQVDPTLCQPGRPASGRRRRPMSEWLHLQHDVYPAYITWEQYLANQERIEQNSLRFVENRQKAQGFAREGVGLLQGLVVCGCCGHHMQTVYKKTPRYLCCGLSRTIDAPATCLSVRAPVVDEVIISAFFEAIQPAQLDALAAILAKQQTEHEQVDRQWQQRLKRTQYEVGLAQRQYDAVDPDNRLVAAELERRWEEKLSQLRQTEENYRHFQQTPRPNTIPSLLGDLFRDVSQKLPELWPSLTNPHKKELLRSLINYVIVRRPLPDQIQMRIVWLSNCYTDHQARTPIHRDQDVTGYQDMVQRIHELVQLGFNDKKMAQLLTTEGFHSARSPHVTPITVQKIRLARQWYLPRRRFLGAEKIEGEFTVPGLAKHLGVISTTIYRYIYNKVIPPEFVKHHALTNVYLIHPDPQLLAQLTQRIAKNKVGNGLLKREEHLSQPLSGSENRSAAVATLPEETEPIFATSKNSPQVRSNKLHLDKSLQAAAICEVDSPEWFAWLEQAHKFRYYTSRQLQVVSGITRSMRPISLRKEKRRQGFFWCAYLRTNGRLHKRYVGRSQALTQNKLDDMAIILNEIW